MEAFKGQVKVLDISEFTQIRPQDLRDRTCVVVGTFASLRVKDTDGRKVYAHNEYLEPHFATPLPVLKTLNSSKKGQTKASPNFPSATC